ncbi:hypothetical protein MATL_G00199320 [Megalops atlanticus]|uniref:AIG1-type G domain-containing protein n=1 Tax=Megalops atlanticus TaxID=7932 RepID=A0A9D3PJW4_MEGAT|nr:hypothetical protein MATL_G00199320 [Megalops atlanticus]
MSIRKKERDGDKMAARERELRMGASASLPDVFPDRPSGSGSPLTAEADERRAPLPELRLVLLGRKGAGKSSACNTILGGGRFASGKPTEECVGRRADVAGRRLVVVDTPGWEWYYPLNGTPEWVRWETGRSATLCPPGPHALLLVVRGRAAVEERYRREIEEHMQLLGEGAWRHTLLLFTWGEELGDARVEQRIEKGGPDLRRLVERCGNRWHVFSNTTRGDGTQVAQLLRKVEEMVAGNGGAHLGTDQVRRRLELEARRRPGEQRRRQRLLESQRQRESLRGLIMGDGAPALGRADRGAVSTRPRRLADLRLVLLGERETGKSSAGNAILGGAHFLPGRVTEECVRQAGEVAGRRVTVVDTPGWEWDAVGSTPERVRQEVLRSVFLCPPGPHALLLVIGVDTHIAKAPVREHLELLGDEVWRHALVLFTRGDKLREGVTIQQHVQRAENAQWLVDRCGNRYHVIDSTDLSNAAQVTELLEKVEAMVAANGGEPFLPMTQDIKQLIRQKEAKFKQTVEDLKEKHLRRERQKELELREREREMRNRWIFDRRNKERDKGVGKPEKSEEEQKHREQEWREKYEKMGKEMEELQKLALEKNREMEEISRRAQINQMK